METTFISGINPFVIALIVLWSIPWKGFALWKAARLSHKWWFVFLLVLNTVGILEIIYIFVVARKYSVETMSGGAGADVASADIAGGSSPAEVVTEGKISELAEGVGSEDTTVENMSDKKL
jgi:hypothetical protein